MNIPSLSNPHSFYEHVWQLARQIPPGRVANYGQLAQRIPGPTGVTPDEYQAFGARWVGAAMSAC
ncbi:MAG: MGMT family protein, partial [Anaerolineales bacterium]|nr:MGMT family protein [Anaerolineales bacterium]